VGKLPGLLPSIDGYDVMAYTPPEAAVDADCGHTDRNVELKPWFPLTPCSGMPCPGTAQKDGPKTPLMSIPDWLRSP